LTVQKGAFGDSATMWSGPVLEHDVEVLVGLRASTSQGHGRVIFAEHRGDSGQTSQRLCSLEPLLDEPGPASRELRSRHCADGGAQGTLGGVQCDPPLRADRLGLQ
jgi:hypothetical protein